MQKQEIAHIDEEYDELVQEEDKTEQENSSKYSSKQQEKMYQEYIQKQNNIAIKESDEDNYQSEIEQPEQETEQNNPSKYKTIQTLDDIDPAERQFMIVNKDTGEIIDMRNEEVVATIVSQTETFQKPAQDIWRQFWRQVREQNDKLVVATEKGDIQTIKQLLDDKINFLPIDVNYQSLDDWTTVHYAACEGQLTALKLLVSTGKLNLRAKTSFNRNALHIAAIKGHIEIGKFLIENEISVDDIDMDQETALHFACEKNNEKFVDLLLQNGASVDIPNYKQNYPLDNASKQNIMNIFDKYGKVLHSEQFQEKERKKKEEQSLWNNPVQVSDSIGPKDFKYYKLLGKGAFGEVFLVRFKDSQQLFAMKVLKKDRIMKQKLQRYVQTEKKVLHQMNHPFITKLHFAFQNDSKLFLVLEYCPGGDLGQMLQKKRRVTEDVARIYIAEIILAIEALHRDMIIYRDLKPENIILDSEGHAKLTDFGLAKTLDDFDGVSKSFLGTPAYFAPEIVTRAGHTRMLDWYTVGILFYELLVGIPPFYARDRKQLFENIKRAPIKIPKSMSEQAKDLIKQLLNRNPQKRLGIKKDADDIKKHPFFAEFNWEDVMDRKLEPPPVLEGKIPEKELDVVFSNNEVEENKFENWTIIL